VFTKIFSKLIKRQKLPAHVKEYLKYLKSASPGPYQYKIKRNKLIPLRKLNQCYKRLSELIPDPLTSFAQIGSARGFFVLKASENPDCTRSLGIDSRSYNIGVCRWAKEYLGKHNARFELINLEELAKRIEEFGGPFQTVLILDTYSELYFGNASNPGLLDHDAIFKSLSQICSERIIFNNGVNLVDCPHLESINRNSPQSLNYSEEKIIEAASQYFNVVPYGSFNGYPLWTIDVKEADTNSFPELAEIFELWTSNMEFREQFRKNPENALFNAGFNFDAPKLQKLKSLLKKHDIRNENLDQRLSR
jgi:hypothetical protein